MFWMRRRGSRVGVGRNGGSSLGCRVSQDEGRWGLSLAAEAAPPLLLFSLLNYLDTTQCDSQRRRARNQRSERRESCDLFITSSTTRYDLANLLLPLIWCPYLRNTNGIGARRHEKPANKLVAPCTVNASYCEPQLVSFRSLGMGGRKADHLEGEEGEDPAEESATGHSCCEGRGGEGAVDVHEICGTLLVRRLRGGLGIRVHGTCGAGSASHVLKASEVRTKAVKMQKIERPKIPWVMTGTIQ